MDKWSEHVMNLLEGTESRVELVDEEEEKEGKEGDYKKKGAGEAIKEVEERRLQERMA